MILFNEFKNSTSALKICWAILDFWRLLRQTLKMDITNIIICKFVCLGLSRSRKQTLVREVCFSDTCQDVATLLGTPQRIFFKAEDKMKIHSPNAHRRVTARRSDFFFNYFSLGMVCIFSYLVVFQQYKLVVCVEFEVSLTVLLLYRSSTEYVNGIHFFKFNEDLS